MSNATLGTLSTAAEQRDPEDRAAWRALVGRAAEAIPPLCAAYDLALDPGRIVHRFSDRYCVDATLWRADNGEVWLLLPGTGGGPANGRLNLVWDWLRNAWSVVPSRKVVANLVDVPKLGESRQFYWCRGFLLAAMKLDAWLNATLLHTDIKISRSVGHSQGGAILEVLAWSRGDLGECHAIGPACSCFSGHQPRDELHCWLAPDDPVGRVPIGASHVGTLHVLPRFMPVGFLRERIRAHGLLAYAERFRRIVEDVPKPLESPVG